LEAASIFGTKKILVGLPGKARREKGGEASETLSSHASGEKEHHSGRTGGQWCHMPLVGEISQKKRYDLCIGGRVYGEEVKARK